jgi:hypothetical protein
MTTFAFEETIDMDRMDTESVALGAAASEAWTVKEVGKLVSLEAASADANYKLAAVDTDIEGFVSSVEAHTVNSGFSFGVVQKNGRLRAYNAGAGALAVGDFVIAAAQVAVGTAGIARVKAGAGTAFKWRVISLLGGAGAVASTVLIERV